MKRRIKFKGIVLALFLFAVAFQSALATDPSVTINYNVTGLAPNTPIVVPVNMISGSNNVGSWQYLIKYDRNVLRLDTIKDVWAGSGSGLWSYAKNYPYAVGDTVLKAGFVYFSGSGEVYNGLVFNIYFTFIGGC